MATAQPNTPFATTGRSRHGEPWVWLTAGGLTLGVIMALGLFVLILVKGTWSFWPRRIDLMEVSTNGVVEKIAGYITQESERRDAEGMLHEEIQVFRGNRDLNGEAFKYIDRAHILKTSRPESLLLVERLEYGPAIVHGVALVTPDGRVEASAPEFDQALEQTLAAGRETRARLLRIERRQIGAISREMEALGRAERSGTVDPQSAAARTAELQKQFETLQAEAAKLRAGLAESSFIGITADGREMTFPAGSLLGVFASNRADFGERIAEMAHRVWKFLSEDPREANTEGGVFPAIFGTVVMTLVMSLFVTPFGVICAIYLREYARQGHLVRIVRISVNNLAGVPSIVFGVFGLAFFVYFVGGGVDRMFFSDKLPTPTYGTPGILWASLTLAILTLPVVIVATEEALSAVPRGVREAALACGASKWQTIQRIVLPASLPGILTGVILAMARGAGEVAPLMLVGVVKLAPSLPIDDIAPFIHPERKFMHLGFHIYDLGFQSPDAEAAKPIVYATALLLIIVVVTLNLTAILIRNRLKKRFATSSF
ncbi:MAG: phosphate ABC transporter permease PstA [Akkermansiaceae bacterium]|jgi:phosphate transport system permease protein|nr:phosphate ABC transporter permease PstA [Akkermansiaceae bacterium]